MFKLLRSFDLLDTLRTLNQIHAIPHGSHNCAVEFRPKSAVDAKARATQDGEGDAVDGASTTVYCDDDPGCNIAAKTHADSLPHAETGRHARRCSAPVRAGGHGREPKRKVGHLRPGTVSHAHRSDRVIVKKISRTNVAICISILNLESTPQALCSIFSSIITILAKEGEGR
jgi:hypothetical protein